MGLQPARSSHAEAEFTADVRLRSVRLLWEPVSYAALAMAPPDSHDRGSVFRIVSGGQTGVDRGALDAALEAGVGCGGWCPADGLAEDGTIPDHYPLRRAPRPGYRERTIRNVLDSDATLIIYSNALSGGTEETLLLCLQLPRPYRLIDGREVTPDRAAAIALELVDTHGIRVLNVAGPRASQWPGAYEYTFRAITAFCAHVRQRQ